ncbi:MAG: hypothetical protein WC907_00385 [Acholeplasmataceae bacterium]
MQIIDKPKSSISKWLLKYRLMILLIAVLFVIPLITITTLYVVNYTKYQKVVFNDKTIKNFKSSYITIEDEKEHYEINFEMDHLIVKVKVMSIKKPIYDVKDPEHEDERGNYIFQAKYVKKGNSNVSNVSLSLILQTDWFDAKSDVKTFNLSTNYSSNQTVAFNQYLPKRPLWFVTVNSPILYAKVSYDLELGIGSDNKSNYFKNNLKEIIPSNIIDDEKE